MKPNLTEISESEKEKLKQDFFQLYKPLHHKLEKYVHATVGNTHDAEDILGQTLVAAVQSFPRLRKPESFMGFLIGIAVRTKKNFYRTSRRTTTLVELKVEDEEINEQSSAAVDKLILADALDHLPLQQKNAIVLFEISGFSIKEIAQIQNSGLSAVKSRLVRGRARLRKMLLDKESKQN